MHLKKRKKFIWLLAIGFLLTQIIISSPIFGQATGTDRIAGADRYKTAVAVSQKGWKSSDYAVLARGDDFADALCAGPLAQKYQGPILLTQRTKLNNDTLKELQRLGVKHLFIAGGVGAVSQSVENALKANGITTIERIYGVDRYETSVKIAEKIGNNNKVVLATGNDFPDALSISGIAAKLGMPILLTGKNSLPVSVGRYFKNNAVTQTYVVGGTSVISAAVANSVPIPSRLAGSDRYGTNVAVMQNFADQIDFDNIYVTVGSQFADALTGAVLAAQSSSPLVLTGKSLPSGTVEYLKTKLKLSSKVMGLGGRNVVPSSVLTAIVTYKEQIPVEEKYSTAGTYGPATGTKTIEGSVIISAANVTLRNTTIEGDLLLGRSIGDGDVHLTDVTVKGKTIVNGGGPNSIIMYNFNGVTVIVDVPDGASVRLVAQGNTSVANVSMEANGTLEESELTGTGFVTVAIPAGAQVILNGNFDQVNVEAAGASVTVASGNITTMNIAENASGTGVTLASGSSVSTLNANAQSNVTGQGQITNANVNASGVSIAQTPTTTTVASGITAEVGGQQQSGTTSPAGGGGGGGGGVDSVAVTGVALDHVTVTITAGTTEILVATVAPANATNKNITWSSSAESVATVENGVVTAVKPGTATITALTADGNKTATCVVRVLAEYDTTATLGDWVQDRTEPKTWSIDENIITLETKEEPNNNWYAWQGRKTTTNMNPTNAWKVETEIDLTEALLDRDDVRTSMWLNVVDAKGENQDWAILQFMIEEETMTRGWQYWDSQDTKSWIDIEGIPTTEGKHQLEIHYNNGTIIQFIDGKEVNSYDIGETGISSVKEVIFNSYSFGESYTTEWKVPVVQYYKKYPNSTKFVFTTAALKTALSAQDSETIVVGPGTYEGNFTLTQPVKLLSIPDGSAAILTGNQGGGELGTVFIKPGVNGVQIGDIDEGFTIVGIDSTPGLEKAAVYFQGANSNSKVIGNIIEANGDAGLMTEYNAAIVNLIMDSNTFSGQTFTGDTPGGDGFGAQFTEANVPRQLVVIGGGASGTNTHSIIFTNNHITGTAGGSNADGIAQGNTLITIDAQDSVITDNTFQGTTTRAGANLRARRPNTTISSNTFIRTGLTSSNYQLLLQNNTAPIEDIAAINYFDYGVYTVGGSVVSLDKDAALASAAEGSTVCVINDGVITETIQITSDNPFIAGEGGNLPAFSPFTAQQNKIGGLYISENHRPLIFYFEGNPIIRNVVEMKFLPPENFEADSYTLQYSTDQGATWANYQNGQTDVTTASSSQDNFSLENPGGNYQYRLLVGGGPKIGYTSNTVGAELSTISTKFTGWSLDESAWITGTMVPFVGRGLEASFTSTKYVQDADNEVYTDENMTYQWYRVNPVSFELIAINGATALTYITTEADAGYHLLIRATGDGVNVDGYAQILTRNEIVLSNQAFVSNVTNNGFTLNLYKSINSLTAGDLTLFDNQGAPVVISSVTPGANNAIYHIAATLPANSAPYWLHNKSEFWRIVSDGAQGHMMMEGVEITF